jgi:sensor histidine kinase YesM
MKNTNTKRKVRIMSFTLFLTVLAVWSFFYLIISDYIAQNTRNQMTFAAEQIIERLGSEFSQIERLSYSLKQNTDVMALARETDPDAFVAFTGSIDSVLNAKTLNHDFIDSIIIFGTDRNNFYRLSGRLGNRSCARITSALSALEMPSHLSLELEGRKYIGYADEIKTDENGSTGAVVVLVEAEKILELLRAFDGSGSLMVAIHARGELVTANTDEPGLFESNNLPVIHSRFGVTPYEISVTARSQYMNNSVVYFTAVAVITAAIFGAVLFIFINLLNRRFFRPMVSVIGNIESLNTGDTSEDLPYVQSEEFDGLIAKINEMLLHIETKNTEVKTAELKTKNAEIEKQKALVFSLKKQINAHFTINTLEAISSLVGQGDLEKANTVSAGLIHLFRYAFDENETINIWDELDILERYTAIMNARYNGKIEGYFDFDDRLMECNMPRMLLQPIIENAVHHGFKDMDSGCRLSVEAEKRGERIIFSISDNGRGMTADDLSALNERIKSGLGAERGYENIALVNIQKRLDHYYNGEGCIIIQSNADGGTGVTLNVPVLLYTEESAV